MKTLILASLLFTLSACGGAAPVAPQHKANAPEWELLVVVPTEPDVEIFRAHVEGYSGMVEGIGPDHESRIYDACAYIASTAKPGSSLYRAMLSSFGAVVYIEPGNVCKMKQEPNGLHIDVITPKG